MLRKRWVAAAAMAAAAYAAPTASAETIYGLTDSDDIVVFDSATPGTTSPVLDVTPPNGVTDIKGIDVRPATLQLYGFGQNGQLFRIDTVTGETTPVGGTQPVSGTNFDIDFNPAVDRLRVVSDADQNLRIDPNTGGAATVDGPLNPSGDVTGAAYTNNAPATATYPAAPTTTLFDIDTTSDQLLTQSPPNNGTLIDGKPLGVNLVGDVGFDISTTSTPGTGAIATNTAYLVGRIADGLDRLYTVNTGTGAATTVGQIGGSSKVKDIAVAAPVPQIAVLYTPLVGAQSIVLYRADRPGAAGASVTISGTNGGEELIGIDRRPNGGTIYGVSASGRVYTLNLATGVATPVGAGPFAPTPNGDAGIDFNPIPDAIRIVTDTDQNLRYPLATNTLATDTPLTYDPADPVNAGQNPNVTAAGYTNSVFPAPASTTLFDVDTGVDDLVVQGATAPGPNGGVLTTVGDLGVQVEDGNGFDIAPRFNQQFGAFTRSLPATGGPELFGVNVAGSPGPPLTAGNGRAVSIGTLGGEPASAVIAGMTVVQDNILPAAPTPGPVATATATATATYAIPTPTATATPGPNGQKVKPNITARAKPKKDRKKPFIFRVQGKLTFPSSVSKAAGCKGTVRVLARKGNKVISRRRTGVKSTCKYKARAKLRKSAGRRGTAKFTVQYLGSNRLLKDSAKTKAKYGKKRK